MNARDGKHTDDADGTPSKPRVPLKARWRTLRTALIAKISPRLERPRQLIRYVRARPVLSSTVGLVVATLLVAFATTWLMVYERMHRKPTVVPLAGVLAKLDAGDFEAARDLAARLFAHGSHSDAEQGGALYVIGAVTFREAEVHEEWADKKKAYLLSARYLEEAGEFGYPAARKVDALEMLSQCYFNVGRYAKALAPLRDALAESSEHRKDLLWLLTTAYMRDSNPQWRKALEANREFLELPDLEKDEKLDASLLQAQLLFRVGDFAGCREQMKLVEESDRTTSELIVIRGRLVMQDAERLLADPALRRAGTHETASHEKLREAIEVFKTAKANEETGNEATRQAAYLLGVCLQKLGETQAAELQFARTHAAFQGTQESLASGLGEADMQRKRGQDEESLKSYLRVLHEAGPAEEFSNVWVSLNEFRVRVEQAYFAFVKSEQFALAIDLANAITPLSPESRSVQLRAEAQRLWANAMVKQADALPRADAERLLVQARAMYRKAGASFGKLSRLRAATEELAHDTWAAGDAFLKGRDYDRAITFIERYLSQESRRNRPTALVSLAEAQLARNRLGAALKALVECLDFFPRDPEAYRAHIVAAQTYWELGNLPEAKKMLLANVESEVLTPESAEWREAIFMLGKLLHFEADAHLAQVAPLFESETPPSLEDVKKLEATHLIYTDAVERMTEALRRFPNARQSLETHYLLAESRRQLVRWPKAKLRTTVLETTRTAMQRDITEQLKGAADEYLLIRETLTERVERQPLTQVETSILRNCVFARADMLYELQQYREAIDEYSVAVARYQNEPEVLEALVQIANCLRATGQTDEARGTVKQAQYILQRLPNDKLFEKTTRYSREGWGQLLNLLATL